MTVAILDLKEDQARHIAMLVVEYQDTDVTHETVKEWTADSVAGITFIRMGSGYSMIPSNGLGSVLSP